MNGKGVLKWALTIGIIIVLNLFFTVAIDIVMPQPQYQDFCPQTQVQANYTNQDSCVAAGGQWNPATPQPQPDGTITKPAAATGYCNPDFTCSQKYSDAQNGYEQNVFTVLVVLGALSVILGIFVRISPAVSAGLSYGGVLAFIIASIRFWGTADNWYRLAIVAVALIALIAVGVKKFRE